MNEKEQKKLTIDRVQFIMNYSIVQEFQSLDEVVQPHYVPSLNSLRYEFDPFHKSISKMKIEQDEV